MPDTILIVDDNRDYARWTESVLQSAGYSVEHAFSATEGLAKVKENPQKFFAIFSDITMEHSGAGLTMIPKMRRIGYQGVVVLESTGFDYPIVHFLSKWTLHLFGVDGLIIKRKMLKEGKWQIDWISKRETVHDLNEKMKKIETIPGWKEKTN